MFNWNEWNHIFALGGMKMDGILADLTWKVTDVGGYAKKPTNKNAFVWNRNHRENGDTLGYP